jgi:hypothetical protein
MFENFQNNILFYFFIKDLFANSDTGDLSNYVSNGEWTLESLDARRHLVTYSCCPIPLVFLIFLTPNFPPFRPKKFFQDYQLIYYDLILRVEEIFFINSYNL